MKSYTDEQVTAAAALLAKADEIEKMPGIGKSLAILQSALTMIPTPELRIAVVDYTVLCERCAKLDMSYEDVERAARLLQ